MPHCRIARARARGQQKAAVGKGTVLGFDIDPRHIELLRQGRDHTGGVEPDALRFAPIRYSADPAEAQRLYGESLRQDLANASGEAPFDCLVGAVAHDAHKALGAAELAKLVRPDGLVCDIKGMWRGRALPDGLRRWEL